MMKMNTKKLGMLTLLAVLVIGVVLISGCARPARKTVPGGITVPSGFTKHTAPFLSLFPEMEGVAATVYVGSGTAENALNVFKSAAIDAGWTRMEGEIEVPAAGTPISDDAILAVAGFEKGNEELLIHIIGQQTGDLVMVQVWVFPKEVEDAKDIVDAPVEEGEVAIPAEAPPTSDVPGEDKKNVPRYPGSVRTGSVGGTVAYVTSASLDEVLAFYEKELPANGWTDSSGRMQIDEATIAIGFEKGDRRLMVQCSRSEDYSDWGPNYTLVLLVE